MGPLFRQLFVHHRVEQPDDGPFDFERVRNMEVAVEQLLDRLRDDGLAVAGRTVDEHRVGGVNGGTKLVHDPFADDEMAEGLAHALAGCAMRRLLLELVHVALVLRKWHRRRANVVVRLEEQLRARTARIGDAVAVGRAANHRTAGDLHLVEGLEHLQCGVYDRELDAEPLGDVGTAKLADEMQSLQDELQHQVERQPGLLKVGRRLRVRQDGQHVRFAC
jgi:hypothetical protein